MVILFSVINVSRFTLVAIGDVRLKRLGNSGMTTIKKKPRGRKGGRRVEFKDGLVVVNVSIRTDQAEWLDTQPNKSASVREALDKLIKEEK